uniref:Uncharacterized protein n=1 Tax=viral metagenome TaxID=1070528 RepID=A0A6H2A1Q5_9ZZZZ
MHWFGLLWWKYLFEKRSSLYDAGRIKTAICRAGGHKPGVWWHNPNGLEPDMHCRGCGDDLG